MGRQTLPKSRKSPLLDGTSLSNTRSIVRTVEAYPWQRLFKARLPHIREVKALEAVISVRFSRGYKRRTVC
jgi:hypothetical protein